MKKNKPISNVTLIQERIERNYRDFKNNILWLDSTAVFDLAPTIAAVSEVYKYTMNGDCLEEESAAYLLQYDNPLKILSDAWKDYNEADEYQMYDLIGDVIDGDDGEDYLSIELADELRDKYGGDIPIEAAIMCEIVELGKKLFKAEYLNQPV